MTSAVTLRADMRLSRPDGFRLDVTLTIGPGRTLALLGPNGAGKSTAVAAIAGLVALDEGRIELGERVLDDPRRKVFLPPPQRRVGVVFQDYLLFPHLSVADNVAFGLRSRRVRRSEAAKQAAAWLTRLRLDDLADRKPAELSGGEAQRVALARALASAPEALLLDEPLAALDATTRVQLRHTLADHLAGFAGPRLLITHDPMEAFLLADWIAVIEGGSISQVGTAEDIRLRPRTRYAADLAGSNLVMGLARGGVVKTTAHELHVGDTRISGAVLATIHPRAISLHLKQPEGSPRNTWRTVITRIEHYGDRVRVQTGEPLPLTAEVTPAAEGALRLQPQADVWVSIKATEIGVEPG